MIEEYSSIKIDIAQAADFAKNLYGVEGEVLPFPGELDLNFKIQGKNKSHIIKFSRPDVNPQFIEFQQELLDYISKNSVEIK